MFDPSQSQGGGRRTRNPRHQATAKLLSMQPEEEEKNREERPLLPPPWGTIRAMNMALG